MHASGKSPGEEIVDGVLGAKKYGRQARKEERNREEAAERGNRGWELFNAHELSPCRPPDRLWIAPDWIPIGAATSLYADGGIGKTLLALQLLCSTAYTMPWCGYAAMKCNSLGLFCEDDKDELHRRTLNICDSAGIQPGDLSGMEMVSGFGLDNTLVEPDEDGRMRSTSQFVLLRKWIRDTEARLVVLDNAADLYGGDENNRRQVRQFIGFPNGLAYDEQCAVLLNAHPSKSGITSGNLDGGNTAWSNSVRSRLTLERPKEDGADPVERILRRPKANYARSGAGVEIRLRWERGVLRPIAEPNGFAAMAREQDADGAFMDMLAAISREGRHVSASSRAGNYGPKVFADRPDRQGFKAKDLAAAMERLFLAGRIKVGEYGKAGGGGKAECIQANA